MWKLVLDNYLRVCILSVHSNTAVKWLSITTVQFSSRWYLCTRKSPYAIHPVTQKFPQRCHSNGSNVRLIDDGPLSSSQGSRSSSASSFHASLLRAIDGVMSLALCPQVVSRASQNFRSSEKEASLSARSFPFTPACPGQHTRRSFWRWMSTITHFKQVTTFKGTSPHGFETKIATGVLGSLQVKRTWSAVKLGDGTKILLV